MPAPGMHATSQAMHEDNELRTAGLKVTVPRLKVLEVFRRADLRHLSAEDVYQRLAKQDADIGLGTVYRVLTQLESAGVLLHSNFAGGKAVYELNPGKHHDHIICLACGRTDEFNDPTIEKRQKAVAEDLGYVLADHQMALFGYCAKCAARRGRG
jgi:Fur family ferric uptake transcriptional regulator